ncbi:uncharacterized protein LOC116158671 [Photinus pyralis]|uniref:uncharacterized protein LOC116158671 n=1 Tax=Photinus pyralis TaxID=7054 RepID=UPI001267685E|nr:uncharacterized protein LOC116158671 [Photinus pyralis]
MYLKLVFASVGLMCLAVTSVRSANDCYRCYANDKDPQATLNCRHFDNITKSERCVGYCMFTYGTFTENGVLLGVAQRYCSVFNCEHHQANDKSIKYCTSCGSNLCNTDKY